MTTIAEPRIDGAGYARLEQVTEDEVMDVLAGRIPTDCNGHDAEYWRKQLEDIDYFTTQSPLIERQILLTLAAFPRAINRAAHENLRYSIRVAIGAEG